MLAVDPLGTAINGQGTHGGGVFRQGNVDGTRNSLRILQLKELSLAQKEGDALHMQGLADALGDGPQQGLGFGEAARLLGEVYQYLIDGVGLAEEAAVNPQGERPGDAQTQKQNDDDKDHRGDELSHAAGGMGKVKDAEAEEGKDDHLQHP